MNAAVCDIMIIDYAPHWLEEAGLTTKASSLSRYSSVAQNHVIPALGFRSVRELKKADVTRWVKRMAADGLSHSTIRQALSVLGLILDKAVRDGIVDRNVARGVKIPEPDEPRRWILTASQLARLAAAIEDYHTFVMLMGLCGLRFGEAAGLQAGDFDPTRRLLRVRRTFQEVSGTMILEDFENNKRRQIKAPLGVADGLTRLMANRDPDDFLFHAPEGGPLRLGNFRRTRFDRAAKQIGCEGLRPADLPDTAAAIAIRGGANAEQVRDLLGLSRTSMVRARYGDLLERGPMLDGPGDILPRQTSIFP